MKVSELKAGKSVDSIELEILDVTEAREFTNKFGQPGRVANATGGDDSGQVKLSLWNDQIEQVHAGDNIKLENGWVSEYKGEKQLSTGKFGKMTVL